MSGPCLTCTFSPHSRAQASASEAAGRPTIILPRNVSEILTRQSNSASIHIFSVLTRQLRDWAISHRFITEQAISPATSAISAAISLDPSLRAAEYLNGMRSNDQKLTHLCLLFQRAAVHRLDEGEACCVLISRKSGGKHCRSLHVDVRHWTNILIRAFA